MLPFVTANFHLYFKYYIELYDIANFDGSSWATLQLPKLQSYGVNYEYLQMYLIETKTKLT